MEKQKITILRGTQLSYSECVMRGGGGDVNYMLMLIRACLNQSGNEMRFTLAVQTGHVEQKKKNEQRNEQKHLQLHLNPTSVTKGYLIFKIKALLYHFFHI